MATAAATSCSSSSSGVSSVSSSASRSSRGSLASGASSSSTLFGLNKRILMDDDMIRSSRDNQNQRMDENTVRYRLYPVVSKSSSHGTPSRISQGILSESDVKEFLTCYIMDIMVKLQPYLSNYIWQDEPFNLQVVKSSSSGGLRSSTQGLY